MKKILEKIVSISLTVVGLLFIALLLVIMFGAVGVEELNNQLVKVLVIALSTVFAVLAVIMITTSFADHDKLNSILLFKDKESATKAAVTVVKSLVKKASKRVDAAKVTKVVLLGDENNNVRLVVYIKVKSNDTESVINRVRAEIVATCDKVLEYQFAAIDFRITQVKADFKPADKDIDAKVAAFQKEKEAAKAVAEAENALEDATVVVSEVVTVEAQSPADEVIAAADEAVEITEISEINDQDINVESESVQEEEADTDITESAIEENSETEEKVELDEIEGIEDGEDNEEKPLE